MLLKTKWLREIVRLGLASSYLKGDDSVSILIIARPESGKTMSLREFSTINGVTWLSDVTYTGLIAILSQVKAGNIKTMLIPDMLKVFGKSVNTRKNFMTFLNEIIEEGVKTIMTYESNIDYGEFVRCNVICAITSTDFFKSKIILGGIGFLSRVIPFSYSYCNDDVKHIFDSIMDGSFKLEFQKFKMSKTKKRVTISKKMADILRSEVTHPLTFKYKMKTKDEVYGFRFQKALQTLAKASALLDKRRSVNMLDVQKIISISQWMNYDMKPLSDE